MRILLVDDDPAIVETLKRLLEAEKYVVDIAYDGISGWDLIASWQYDLILLDVMLPQLDGITFCRRLREQKNPVLVMLLTSRDTMTDKIVGLDSGADDYLVKPCNPQELSARIRALIRRQNTPTQTIITCGDLSLDPNLLDVSYQGKILQLSRKEYLIVELFLRNQKRVYSCRDIVDHLWELDSEPPNEATVRSHIKNIRRHLKCVGAKDFLETVYGKGYKIKPSFMSVNNNHELAPSFNQQQMLDNAVAEIWKQAKNLSFERLTVLQNVVESLKIANFNEELYQQAIQNSHKLAGSLGIFGFDKGSSLARKIEQLLVSYFEDKSHFKPCYQRNFLAKIEPLVMGLYHELQVPLELPSHNEEKQPMKAKILAVDDDIQILMILKALLEPLGVQLTCLSTIDNFWTTLKSTQPDFLILDINIPYAHEGLNLCQSIRKNNEWNWLPIVFLTGCTDEDTLQQAFIIGADDLLTKPILEKELLIRIRNRYERIHAIKNHFQGVENKSS